MQEVIEVNYSEFRCCENNQAVQLCFAQNCDKNAFLCCKQNCICHENNHQSCQIYRLKTLIGRLYEKKKKIPPEVQKSFKAIEKIYQDLIQTLSQDREELRLQRQLFGLTQTEKKFISFISENKHSQITGHLVNQVKKQLNIKQKLTNFLNQNSVNVFWQGKKAEFKVLFDNLRHLSRNRSSSFIVKDFSKITNFFTRTVTKYSLLYRASQNQFKASQFHRKCDNITNTLVIIKTQYDKIIGGFTPLTWNSSAKNQYTPDHTSQSFIFSLTLGEKYRLIQQLNAINCDDEWGPCFGSGCDIFISNNANINNHSGSNFPSSYNNNKNYQNNQETYFAFCGATNDCNFVVKQWQVFQVQFESDGKL